MNKKENILDAWIIIEHLSEGTIKKDEKNKKPFQAETDDLHKFFTDFLMTEKEKRTLKDEDFKKSGMVAYFGIFDFQEIVEILRDKYDIEPTYSDSSKEEKFTCSLYFDHQLNFLADKFFFTASGSIRDHGDLPRHFAKEENDLREDLNRKFDEDFNAIMSELFLKYQVSHENFRFEFIENMNVGTGDMHSFFIEDLQKAKNIQSQNLDRYFEGFSGERKNLDVNQEPERFRLHIFEEILQPKYYPLGRFPSNPDHALSLMQQIAVNLALNDRNEMRSVNGPPGTGKTTLLKDVFADLLVQQAVAICEMPQKKLLGGISCRGKAELGILPNSISEKNIVVASSNNGAVQNIVNELPRIKGIAEEFQTSLEEADYFRKIANMHLSRKTIGEEGIPTNILAEENWGTFSMEGGKSANITRLLSNIGFIEKELTESYSPNPEVYKHFMDLHRKLSVERQKIQSYCELIHRLPEMQHQFDEAIIQTEKLNKENNDIEADRLSCSLQLQDSAERVELAKRTLEFEKSQSPPKWLLGLWRIFNKKKANRYAEKINQAEAEYELAVKQRKELERKKGELDKKQKKNSLERTKVREQIEQIKWSIHQWMHEKPNKLETMNREMLSLDHLRSQSGIQELDLTQNYDSLQQSNPWFNKEFRIMQSQLFIAALKVRKQFLFENHSHLKKAKEIWGNPRKFLSEERSRELITESWQWLNFAIPVVSTTFASFGRMFRYLDENSIGSLFVDEAGQALPQASVGAIFRSKKVMVVGDPSQIKPVLTLDSNMLTLIARYYEAGDKFVSESASTQTLVDAASQYGFWKSKKEWIGIPLWVHRRSDDPMFTISNELSYQGLMVQGKPKEQAQGKAKWYHATGVANDKFVKEQADLLKSLIHERLTQEPELKNEIYVISPFRNVAYQLARALDEIQFTQRENGKPTNVGTVHTFQGKEAKIVYFVLGADSRSEGAARWSVSEPNMVNVAATRAKNEFYVIGDKELYAHLGSDIANDMISIIDSYNHPALV